jgi:hypothetical protein
MRVVDDWAEAATVRPRTRQAVVKTRMVISAGRRLSPPVFAPAGIKQPRTFA